MSEQNSYALARKMVGYSLTKKARDVRLLELSSISSMTDYFVICHGESDNQVKAIADAIVEGMESDGIRVWHKEGYDYLHWVLLDYVDVVVHVFIKEMRDYYGLERLWGDAKIENIQDET